MARKLLAALIGWLAFQGPAWTQVPDTTPATPIMPEATATDARPPKAASGEPPAAAASNGNAGAADRGTAPVAGNPAAVNIVTGTGALGEFLGFTKDSGVYLGGLWIGDANWLAAGGLQPGQWGLNSLTLANLTLDFGKIAGWQGGLFGIEFLQFTGQPTNAPAGVVQGFNSLPGAPPLARQELYQLWWRQALFDNKLIVRVGKSVPTYDFNNVIRPVPTNDPTAVIPAVSGLIYAPISVNPTTQGKLPGYYNSATGITATAAPVEHLYVSYGCYDGNQATGEQTGLRGPQFNGYYFHIGELGFTWTAGEERKPGNAAVGLWYQTGKLAAANRAIVNGAAGVYAFGAQRLWLRNPGIDNSGVSGFWQFGATNSNTSAVRQYFGAGLTAFGLIPRRKDDSFGGGLAWSWLNTDPHAGAFFFPDRSPAATTLRTNELMLQAYYQMNVRKGVYFQPAVSYIPNPGQRPDIPGAFALTATLMVLF